MATRRTFLLRTLAFIGTGISLRSSRVFAARPRFAIHGSAARLIACVDAKRSAEIIGVEYLRAFPAEGNAEQLANLIFSSFGIGYQDLVWADRQEIKSLLGDQQRQDFAADRVVDVGGWILSRTEARLYALTALSAAAR